jgi:hypothetical protein
MAARKLSQIATITSGAARAAACVLAYLATVLALAPRLGRLCDSWVGSLKASHR